MDTAGVAKSASRAKSCVVCRQYKLKCDARKTSPNPCSRCVSKSLRCRFDPNFQRIPTRKIVQEIADGIHGWRAGHTAVSPPKTHDATTNLSPSTHETSREKYATALKPDEMLQIRNPSTETSQSGQPWLNFAEDHELRAQRLGAVELEPSQILYMFQLFQMHRLPHARFLRPLRSISSLIKESELLFWTIILVTFDRHDGTGIYEQIAEPHEILLSRILRTSTQQIEVIHALLLLCIWPVPKLRNSYDPSWNYVGLVTNAAMALDCHSPIGNWHLTAHWKGTADTTANRLSVENQAMTWLACFEVGSWQSSFLGYAPPMTSAQHNRYIRHAIKNAAAVLPDQMTSRIEMLCLRDAAVAQLDFIDDIHSHSVATDSFVVALENHKKSNENHWDDMQELTYNSAILYMRGMTLVRLLTDENAPQGLIHEHVAVLKCFEVAKTYVSLMARISSRSVKGFQVVNGELGFFPKHFYSNLFMAVTYIWRFLVSGTKPTDEQKLQGVQAMIEAHELFQSFLDHRDAVRAAIQIELLMEIYETHSAAQTLPINKLAINHRFAASVRVDAGFRVSDYQNRNPIDGSPMPIENWQSINVQVADRLPLAPEQKREKQTASYSDQSQELLLPLAATEAPGTQTWANYVNDFGLINEPFAVTDTEFGAPQNFEVQDFAADDSLYMSHVYPM